MNIKIHVEHNDYLVGGIEQLIFTMTVSGGLHPVDIYAKRDFATQLYSIKPASNITVYGETMVINSSSRMDGGNVGSHLAVQLDKVEVK